MVKKIHKFAVIKAGIWTEMKLISFVDGEAYDFETTNLMPCMLILLI